MEKFIKWLAAKYITEATISGWNLAKQEFHDNRETDKLFELKALVGKKVITFSNEWEDMLIGTVTGIDFITQAKQPVLMIKDCFSGIVYISFGQVYEYDRDTLEALLRLNPYERWNLKVPHAKVKWDKQKTGQITNHNQFRDNLQTIGFL